VPVAAEVARALHAPLDALLVRKLGVPGQEELAMGAIASGEVRVLAEKLIAELGLDEEQVARVAAQEGIELARRERLYRAGRPAPAMAGRTVVLVDDGLATGATMHAAVQVARGLGAARVIVAVPVGHPAICGHLAGLADEVVCLERPDELRAVGQWYEDFSPVEDDEVVEILSRAQSVTTAARA
jgi:predicted phosphoribosyltransferase